jgi:hypothetical protein
LRDKRSRPKTRDQATMERAERIFALRLTRILTADSALLPFDAMQPERRETNGSAPGRLRGLKPIKPNRKVKR